ncbi:unnamed protein product, partial [Ectocarpus sp. 12 AP-2014]
MKPGQRLSNECNAPHALVYVKEYEGAQHFDKPPAAVSSPVPDPPSSLLPSHSTHQRPSTATMFPTRSMIGVLAMLLLSARLEAFSVRPAVTRRGSKADRGSSGSGRALAPSAVSDRGTLAAASWLWTGASGSPRSTALRMGLETVTGLTSTDMQAREFQMSRQPKNQHACTRRTPTRHLSTVHRPRAKPVVFSSGSGK